MCQPSEHRENKPAPETALVLPKATTVHETGFVRGGAVDRPVRLHPVDQRLGGGGIIQAPAQSGAVAPFRHTAGAAAALLGFCMMAVAAAVGVWIGIGYNGTPSEPDAAVWLYQPKTQQWRKGKVSTPVMDLRNLLELNGEIYSLGGMTNGQQVQSDFIKQQITLLPD